MPSMCHRQVLRDAVQRRSTGKRPIILCVGGAIVSLATMGGLESDSRTTDLRGREASSFSTHEARSICRRAGVTLSCPFSPWAVRQVVSQRRASCEREVGTPTLVPFSPVANVPFQGLSASFIPCLTMWLFISLSLRCVCCSQCAQI